MHCVLPGEARVLALVLGGSVVSTTRVVDARRPYPRLPGTFEFFVFQVRMFLAMLAEQPLPSSPGRYDRFLTPEEVELFSSIPCDDLTPEIEILRDEIERFNATLCRLSPDGQPHPTSADLRALATALAVLADLIRYQLEAHAPLDEFQAEVEQAFHQTRIKKGLLPPDDPPPSPPEPAGESAYCPETPPSPACPPAPLLHPPSLVPCNPPVMGRSGASPPIRSP